MKASPQQKDIYCFDTSAFLTLSRTSENIIELPNSLWDHLDTMMKSGEIISHEIVFNEMSSKTKKPDFITEWIRDKENCFFKKTDIQAAHMIKIIQKFPKLIDPACEKEQADPWLIALAIERSNEQNLFEACTAIVVSQEGPRALQKIPAVCKEFGVKHISLRSFFEEIGLSTSISRKAL